MGEGPEVRSLKSDVNEMQHMLEDYLAFARGDGGEEAKPTNLERPARRGGMRKRRSMAPPSTSRSASARAAATSCCR